MPPPFRIVSYRGYELVQWFDGGPFEVSWRTTGQFISTEHADLEGVQATVDEWLDAP